MKSIILIQCSAESGLVHWPAAKLRMTIKDNSSIQPLDYTKREPVRYDIDEPVGGKKRV